MSGSKRGVFFGHRSVPTLTRLSAAAALCGVTLCAMGRTAAAQQRLKIDPSQSEVHFTLADPLHAVHGTFRVQSGVVAFDQEGGRMTGTIAVDAASGSSGNGTRDKKMTNDELKAGSFSTVTFAPKHYTGTLVPAGDSNITVDGTFTLLGTAHPITVPMLVHMDGKSAKATGSFTVPYVQWGVKDPSTFLLHVGKEVTIDILLVGPVTAEHVD